MGVAEVLSLDWLTCIWSTQLQKNCMIRISASVKLLSLPFEPLIYNREINFIPTVPLHEYVNSWSCTPGLIFVFEIHLVDGEVGRFWREDM